MENKKFLRGIERRDCEERKKANGRILEQEKLQKVFQRKKIVKNSQYQKNVNRLSQLAKFQAQGPASFERDTPRLLNLDSEDCRGFSPKKISHRTIDSVNPRDFPSARSLNSPQRHLSPDCKDSKVIPDSPKQKKIDGLPPKIIPHSKNRFSRRNNHSGPEYLMLVASDVNNPFEAYVWNKKIEQEHLEEAERRRQAEALVYHSKMAGQKISMTESGQVILSKDYQKRGSSVSKIENRKKSSLIYQGS